MNLDRHTKALADVLVRVAVREITARRAGKEKARAPLIQANGLEYMEQTHDIRRTALRKAQL